ncbi:MAG: LysR family transcriptional regulator [Deltaproteobacteria bacterium]|nr:MAG: LysR family transcriptional regulator [Deltaproteobacteria bacterium]
MPEREPGPTSVPDGLSLDQLRVFVEVARAGSFSAAARRLHRAQSAVSYAIANLERILGIPLFDRSRRRPVLTEWGQSLLPDAQQVLADARRLATRAAGASRGLEPEVCLAVDAICPTGLLVELAAAYREAYPEVPLRLQTDVLEGVTARLEDGRCQLAVAGPVGLDSDRYHVHALGELEMVPVAARTHPLATLTPPLPSTALRRHVQVVISQHAGGLVGSDRGVLSPVTWRVADAATKHALIRAGLGWGNLPRQLVEADLAAGTLVALELEAHGGRPPVAPLFVVTLSGAPPGPAGQWIVGWLRARAHRWMGARTAPGGPTDPSDLQGAGRTTPGDP